MASNQVDELFDHVFLKRLEALGIAARQLVKGRQRAERRSVQRGVSVEFAEYRPFVFGDDFRYIDWNAYARWRQLVLKLFVEEEDLHVHFLLDCSRSMDWGSPVKFDYARQVLAGLAWMTLSNMDRAGVVPLGHLNLTQWPPSRGRDRFLQLLRFLAACPLTDEPPQLENNVHRWISLQPRKGMVVYISDLWGRDQDDSFRALDRLRYSRNEISVIQIMDQGELNAGAPGEFEIEDCESGSRRSVIIDSRTAREYQERFVNYQNALRKYCRSHQISLLQLQTSTPVSDVLMKCLVEGGVVR